LSYWLEIVISAPEISGTCSFVNSTTGSLTFTWNSATSATSYRLVGDGVEETSTEPTITVSDLRAGSHYSFTVWAVSDQRLTSNNITCANSTGRLVACCCLI